MAYDEAIAKRIRGVLKRRKGITEKKMFGGIAFLHNGNMVCGVNDGEMMLRLGNEGAADALAEKHVRAMDFTGKPIKSMVYLDPKGFKKDEDLRAWVNRAITFAKTLPAK